MNLLLTMLHSDPAGDEIHDIIAGSCAGDQEDDNGEPDDDGADEEDEFRQVEDDEEAEEVECESHSPSRAQTIAPPGQRAVHQQRPRSRLLTWLTENYKVTCAALL